MKEIIGIRSKKMATNMLVVIIVAGLLYISNFHRFIESELRGLVITTYILIGAAIVVGINNIFFIPNYVIIRDGDDIILRNGWWKKTIPLKYITKVQLLSKDKEKKMKLLFNPETVRFYCMTEKGEKKYEICDVKNKEEAVERMHELLAKA